MTPHPRSTEQVLTAAARIAGVDTDGAELIRDGSNAMYRLPGQVVARIGRAGTHDTAEREVRVSTWLDRAGLPATRALPDLEQPVIVDDRPVTWWALLPKHRPATPAELGATLRALHALPVPDNLTLPVFDPFANLDERIAQATGVTEDDRDWLAHHLVDLRHEYAQLGGLSTPHQVIHGDAWQGNVAVTGSNAPILLDLEHVSIGDRAWDLIPIAVDYTDFGRLTADDYVSFVDAYGRDVTTDSGFRTRANIQELRWACFVLSKAETSTDAASETRHRIACLRGDVRRPWSWTAF